LSNGVGFAEAGHAGYGSLIVVRRVCDGKRERLHATYRLACVPWRNGARRLVRYGSHPKKADQRPSLQVVACVVWHPVYAI